MVQLRDYQQRGVDDIRRAFGRGVRRLIYTAPTGAGKTVMFSYITRGAEQKGNRVYILLHRRFLVQQVASALHAQGVPHGILMGGYSVADAQVQVASVPTVVARLDKLPEPGLIVVDEAHHAVARQWTKILDHWPRAKVLGVTATPERLDGKGLGDVFDDLVHGPSVQELIDKGWLAPFDLYAPPEKVDLSQIKTERGDFKKGDLEAATDQQAITGDAVEHYRQHLQGRPAIAFCVTVDHARHVAERFQAAGFRAAYVDGSMKTAERERRVDGLRTGKIQVLTSCDLISEGFDVPATAGAILLRPTKSRQLYFQQVGRALRPKDGARAVILDHVGNSHRHGLPSTPIEWTLEGSKGGQGPTLSTCKRCYAVFSPDEKPTVPLECPDQQGAACGMLGKSSDGDGAGGREVPAQQQGQLEKLDEEPAWAAGINIRTAGKEELGWLVENAESIAQLKHIQRVRGYKNGWLYYKLRDKGWLPEKKGQKAQEGATA
jgi:superfamily II DNA or RNA helicase